MMRHFDGFSAFPMTPADADGHVDTDALCRLLTPLGPAGVQSIGLLGSTGTYVYLNRPERRRAIDAAVECLEGTVPLVVGVGALRTAEARALARDAEQAGADAVLLAPVSYTPLTEDEVYEHYRAVADATELPLCIYNNPTTTHFTFSTTLLSRLAGLPGITAVKMPLPVGNDFTTDLKRLRASLPEHFSIGYSGDWGCAAGLLSGADAWYSVVGGILPVPALQLADAAKAGNTSAVHRIESRFQPLWHLFREFGSLRVVYAIAREMSLIHTDPPRPILPLCAQDHRRVVVALDELTFESREAVQ